MHKGIEKFRGPVKFSKGRWVGIQCDKPVGRNNGTVKKACAITIPIPLNSSIVYIILPIYTNRGRIRHTCMHALFIA